MTQRRRGGKSERMPLDYGDPEEDVTPSERPRRRVRVIYFWDTGLVVKSRAAMCIFSLIALASIAAIFLIWAFNVIPAIPPDFTRYGVILFIEPILAYLMSLAISFSETIEYYAISAVLLQIPAFVLISYTFATILYNFIACSIGTIPSTCVDYYWPDTIMVVPIIILFVTSLIVLISNLLICFRYWYDDIRSRGARRRRNAAD